MKGFGLFLKHNLTWLSEKNNLNVVLLQVKWKKLSYCIFKKGY